ncbi:hypothetical protein RDMS_04865 [Deinococcus sp. RL]|nr:hypothetical protein RDMS_04865 [Deinococcus sp. RL]
MVASPGSGKSRHTREAIEQLLLSGKVRHVLWATQSTRDETSLGQEALDHFRDLGLDAEIVYGEQHLRDQGRGADYRGQFAWPAGPAVRIVSHSHLPLIFGGGSGPQAALASADLLVIDEDPLGALLIDSLTPDVPKFTADALLTQSDPTAQALGQLLRAAESGEQEGYREFAKDVRKIVSGYGLYGEAFWQHLLAIPHDPKSFEQALRSITPRHGRIVELLARTFDDDLAAAKTGTISNRFGLHGVQSGKTLNFQFRYNLRWPLEFPIPTVILDAYARQEQYEALFREHKVRLHRFSLGTPLEIEEAPMLELDVMDEGRERRLETRRHIAGELLALHKENPERGQLLITPQRLKHEGAQWQGILKTVYDRAGVQLGLDATSGHWFAGRGKNEYRGRDMIALTAPRLPKMHREYTLSALLPYDEAGRNQLHQYLEATEYLQLLHRGRQQADGIVHKHGTPRVIAADADVLRLPALKPYVNIRPYKTILPFKPHSNTPRWRAATEAIAREVLDELGGVPREVLAAVGFVKSKNAKETLENARDTLEVLAPMWSPTSAMYRAFRERDTWEYGDVGPAGDNNADAEKEVMAGLGLTAFKIKVRGGSLVYARTQEDADQAYDLFAMKKAIVRGDVDITLPEPDATPAPTSHS